MKQARKEQRKQNYCTHSACVHFFGAMRNASKWLMCCWSSNTSFFGCGKYSISLTKCRWDNLSIRIQIFIRDVQICKHSTHTHTYLWRKLIIFVGFRLVGFYSPPFSRCCCPFFFRSFALLSHGFFPSQCVCRLQHFCVYLLPRARSGNYCSKLYVEYDWPEWQKSTSERISCIHRGKQIRHCN